ncbi:uncharacterized protein LOC143042207 isoform X1 [Mytilus galloprovincialis]|uniref:uncharacterized protein LOC143042207 isoform X1 n=1 Tax=Mytilus galloprovincialis TaxID=29158 RepID=UPI003F7CB90D
MYICSLSLIMSLWKLSESGFSFHCPVQSHWKHIAEHRCGSVDSYFCLFNRNDHYFTEFCRKQSDFEAPGQKLIVAGSSNGTLQGADCNSEFYQPFKFLSSGSSRCVYEKSYCSGEGQVVFTNGTLENDRSCRCDYTRGYDFVNKPRHRCYCAPSEEDCSCHLKLCQSNYILSPDYECLNENEWKPNFHCNLISTVVLPKDTETSLSVDKSSLENYVIAYKNARVADQGVVKWTLAASILSVLAVLGIFCFLRKKCKGTEIDENLATWKAIEQSTSEKQIEEINIEAQELEQEVDENIVTEEAIEQSSSKKQIEGIDIEKQKLLLELQEKTLLNWSNELAKFVVTKTSQYIYQAIKTDQLVAIIGSTGTGKSACAKHIAFRLKNEYGYTIVSPRQPSDIKQYFLPGTKQVFIIDDFIGKNAFDEAEAVSWDEGPFIYKILSTNDQSKVILTCRKTIWNPEICERLRLSASTFDLHTENMRLNLLERRTICETYLEKNTLDDKIIMMYPFLPSLCSIFSSEEAGKVEDFFTFPIQFIEEEINDYKKKSPVCHISLAVLAIKQKIIRKSFLAGNDRHLIIDLIWESGSQVRPLSELIHVIVSQLTALTDSYVKVDKGCFEFIHETMQDIVLYCIAKTFLKSVLKYSKSDVIKGKVELACIKNDQTGPVIEVGSEYEDEYFSRLARDLSHGQFADVFENNRNSFPLFRQKFLTYLKNNKQNIHFKSDSNGSTVLHVLSSLGYSDYVSYVITLDTGMTNKIDAKGNTPLHLASMSGHLSVLKLLVGNGGNVEMLNKEELSPFFYACENNSISVVHYLLNSKKDFVKINKKYMKRENKSVLHIACLKGYIEIVKILLDHRATVDIPDAGELTPLHLACSNGQYKTAELLLNSGANVNALDKLGRTPVYHACTGDYKDIVKLLIKRKANINKSTLNGSTPLHAACEHEIVDIVNILLNNGAKVDVQDREVGTPLHLACRKGNGRIVQLLIDNRASINLKTKKDKMRPFHEACQNGHLNVIEILLENGVNYEKQNEQGWTGLFFSCANGNNHIVKTILSRKTDVNRVNQDRITALHIACMKNHEDVVNTLINKKANVNVTDIRGETSLYKACFNGNIEIVKILLHREADVKICSFRGLSPVAIAKKKGFNDIVALLDNKHN